MQRERHPYNHDCLQSLRMVFRSPTDQGSQRMQTTPTADTLRAELLDFKSKWESVSYEGKHVLPPAAVREVLSLLTNVQKGGLSGIRPGCGTTRNERLHRDLNLYMMSAKYGVEIAYALLTSAFFKHNEQISERIEERHAKPIAAYSGHSLQGQLDLFGLSCVCPTKG